MTSRAPVTVASPVDHGEAPTIEPSERQLSARFPGSRRRATGDAQVKMPLAPESAVRMLSWGAGFTLQLAEWALPQALGLCWVWHPTQPGLSPPDIPKPRQHPKHLAGVRVGLGEFSVTGLRYVGRAGVEPPALRPPTVRVPTSGREAAFRQSRRFCVPNSTHRVVNSEEGAPSRSQAPYHRRSAPERHRGASDGSAWRAPPKVYNYWHTFTSVG